MFFDILSKGLTNIFKYSEGLLYCQGYKGIGIVENQNGY